LIQPGELFLVPTPIGNLDDITLRSIKVLQAVDKVICEDTRVTGKLMSHLEIRKPLVSNHSNNEHRVTERFIEMLENGEKLALVSDAGAPAISDPGFLLVRAAVEKGIKITPLPGATAFVPALTASGLPCNNFYFEGFLPHKKGRQTRATYLMALPCTFLLYESPHRLLKTLELLKEFDSERKVSVSREITKLYEEHFRGTLVHAIERFTEKAPKGEFVITVAGKS
jgi:16S rRNA (cytidine1402-2'-O)-methyltransferase